MGKSVQELQDMLAAKMKEVDAIQVEIEQAKMREQVRIKLDLMLDFVLVDDKLCKQILLLDNNACDDVGRKWAKSMSTIVKKCLDGDAPKLTAKETPNLSHLTDGLSSAIDGAFGVVSDKKEDSTVAPEKKPRKPRAKKESVEFKSSDVHESKAEEKSSLADESKDDETTAAVEEVVTDGSATAVESDVAQTKEESVAPIDDAPMKKPTVEKKAYGSKMFNPARMMAEMKSSNKKKK